MMMMKVKLQELMTSSIITKIILHSTLKNKILNFPNIKSITIITKMLLIWKHLIDFFEIINI